MIKIFLVEDNLADAKLMKRALALVKGLEYDLEVFSDGEAVLKVLHKRLPNLMIIDINLPKVDGKQLLIELKKNNRTCHIPILVLTTSFAEEDIKFMYVNGASAYITKPFDLMEYVCIMQTLGLFWMKCVRYTI